MHVTSSSRLKLCFWQSWNCNNYSALLLALLPKCIVHSVVCDSKHVIDPCVWLPFLPLSYPVHTAAVCISSHRGSLFSNGNLLKLIAVFKSRRDLYKPRRDLNKPRRDLKTKRCSEKITYNNEMLLHCYTNLFNMKKLCVLNSVATMFLLHVATHSYTFLLPSVA